MNDLNLQKTNFDTLNSIKGVYNFSTNKEFTSRYGKKTYSVLLNVSDPLEEENTGEYVDDMDAPLSNALFKIGIQTDSNPFAQKANTKYQNKDAFINTISGDHYIQSHPISGVEFGVPKQKIVSVFDSKKIHILGSKQDIEGFDKYMKQKNKSSKE